VNNPPTSRRERVVRSRVYRALLRRLTPDLLAVTGGEMHTERQFANVPLTGRVLVYFPDDVSKAYQLEQWLPVLDDLHRSHPVLVVTRNLGTFRALADRTTLPLVFARRLRDLNDVLVSADPGVCLYVNNSARNFQALGWPRALHAHVNHGESDKISMATNQVKAYDEVFVAGPAAVQRYLDNVLALPADKLVPVGRPQLDLHFDPVLPPSPRATVLYAPTWEGETPAMDYSSLPVFGVPLVEALVCDGGFRVVYKPHPKLLTGSRAAVAAHERVCALLTDQAEQTVDGGHRVEIEPPILALFASCDALVSDVSSVALDWLYLRTSRPLWTADPRGDRRALERASPLAAWTGVLDAASAPGAAGLLREGVLHDPAADLRAQARTCYFGELQPGESSRRFREAIAAALARRDELLRERRRTAHAFELVAGAS
jgi:hypothetical protein